MSAKLIGRQTAVPASLTDLPPTFHGIEAVCFDAFGTLVEITDKRQAYRPLLKALSPEKRRALKRRLMREDRSFTQWLRSALGFRPHQNASFLWTKGQRYTNDQAGPPMGARQL